MKLKDWLINSVGKKTFDPYFKKDSQQNDLFLPWGNGGECYLLNSKQIERIKIHFAILIWLMLVPLVCMAAILDFSLITAFVYWINIIAMCWFVLLYIHCNKLNSPKENKYKDIVPKLIEEFKFFSAANYVLVAIGLFLKVDDPLFVPISILIVLGSPVLWLCIKRSQGFIFSKRPEN